MKYQNIKSRLFYDLRCKEIISNKIVIARILQKLVYDFKDLPIETIKDKCLLSDDRDNNKVKMIKRKISDINCDLLFEAYTIQNNEIAVIINIEAQNHENKYPLENRCEYYVSKLFSRQKHPNNDYSKLKKVYSIWIYADSTKDSKSDIYVYPRAKISIQNNKTIINNPLTNFIIINIGNDYLNNKDDLINYLSALLMMDNSFTYKQRKAILKDDIIIYAKDEQEAEEMCNLSQYYVDKGAREGYEIGVQKGLEQGVINNSLTNIINLMSSLNITFDKAIEILKVSDDIKDEVIRLYKENYS